MNWTNALRGFVGVVMAIAFSTAGPAAAAGGVPGSPATETPAGPIQPLTACTPGARSCPIRITFAPGAYSGQGHSEMLGIRSQRWFVVHARAGQVMIVIVEGRGATRGVVSSPGGSSNGQPGGRVFDASVPRTGDYRIHVTESPMGQGWSGRVDVVVVIY